MQIQALTRHSARTVPYDGAARSSDRNAHRGNSRPALEGCEPRSLASSHVAQAIYRGTVSTPKTKASRRILPLPQLRGKRACLHCVPAPGRQWKKLWCSAVGRGHRLNDTNLLLRHLKPAGRKIGTPWLSWHTLRRTHATQLQMAGGTIKDAQAQLGHSKLSTTLEIYTLPVPGHQRTAVENLARMVTNGDGSGKRLEGLPSATQQIQ